MVVSSLRPLRKCEILGRSSFLNSNIGFFLCQSFSYALISFCSVTNHLQTQELKTKTMILWVSSLGWSQLSFLVSVVSCWVNWVIAAWSERTSAGIACLCSMRSLSPQACSGGNYLQESKAQAQNWHSVTSATFCLPNPVTGATQTQRIGKQTPPLDWRSFQTTLQRVGIE